MHRSSSSTAHPPHQRHSHKSSASSSKSGGGGGGAGGNLRRTSSACAPPAPAPALLQSLERDSRARAAAAQQRAAAQGALSMTRTPSASASSFEPKSVVGFDTSLSDERAQRGTVAPPPTPAQPKSKQLAASPPSAMRVPQSGTLSTAEKKKKLFFISSPNSESDEDGPSSSIRSRSRATHPQQPQPGPSRPPPAPPKLGATVAAVTGEGDDDEWDDEDDSLEDDDASSGWGSDYSTEEDSPSQPSTSRLAGPTPQPPVPLFAKVPSQPDLKPRGPGLLSQLFHPELLVDERRQNHSASALVRGHKSMVAMPTTSRSTGNMPPPGRSSSYLRGKPEDVELESSSDDDSDQFDDESPESQHDTLAAALARHQRNLHPDPTVALPQTPRTTRRAMLATELSESLRRNLLWERQTRNRPVGRPSGPPQLPPSHQPQTQQTQANLVPPPAFDPRQVDGGLMAPHPSPATRDSSPIEPLTRRHTTGTGMYLLAQQNGRMQMSRHSPNERAAPNPLLRPSPPTVSKPQTLYEPGDESASDSSADEEERDRPRGYASPAEGVRVW